MRSIVGMTIGRALLWAAAVTTTFCIAGASAGPRDGGWQSAFYGLQPGWNAIWLFVDPANPDPADMFAGVSGFKSVHTFIPATKVGQQGIWVRHVAGAPSFVNTLVEMHGQQGYLIDMDQSAPLVVVGRPIQRNVRLSGIEPTMVGTTTSTASGSEITFEKYLGALSPGSLSDVVTSAFAITSNGLDTRLLNTVMEHKTAYWINPSQNATYAGPLRTNAPINGIQFRDDGYSFRLRIDVPLNSSNTQTVKLRSLNSVGPPGDHPTDATGGDRDWIQYENPNYDVTSTGLVRWLDMPTSAGSALALDVPAGASSIDVVLRANRSGRSVAYIADPTNPASADSIYQARLRIDHEYGYYILLGVGMEIRPVQGIWIGEALLTNVSHSTHLPAQADTSAPPMRIPLILELTGESSFTGRLLPEYSLDVDRDGNTLTIRRMSALFCDEISMAGSLANGTSGTLTASHTLAANHSLNPYRHRYHPEHGTGIAVTRDITMNFAANLPMPEDEFLQRYSSVVLERLGANLLVGTYQEVISGVSLDPITVSGEFRLVRFADAPVAR